jgi:hypothetical protein
MKSEALSASPGLAKKLVMIESDRKSRNSAVRLGSQEYFLVANLPGSADPLVGAKNGSCPVSVNQELGTALARQRSRSYYLEPSPSVWNGVAAGSILLGRKNSRTAQSQVIIIGRK